MAPLSITQNINKKMFTLCWTPKDKYWQKPWGKLNRKMQRRKSDPYIRLGVPFSACGRSEIKKGFREIREDPKDSLEIRDSDSLTTYKDVEKVVRREMDSLTSKVKVSVTKINSRRPLLTRANEVKWSLSSFATYKTGKETGYLSVQRLNIYDFSKYLVVSKIVFFFLTYFKTVSIRLIIQFVVFIHCINT